MDLKIVLEDRTLEVLAVDVLDLKQSFDLALRDCKSWEVDEGVYVNPCKVVYLHFYEEENEIRESS